MAIATGIAKQVRYKKETTLNTAPGASGAQLVRRVESTVNIDKDTYQSAELRTDYQIADFRHGTRKTSGSIKGELSPGTYADFLGSALRRDFAAVTAITGLSLTIAAGSLVAGVQQYTVTRAAGDFLTGGVKAGDVVRLSGGSLNASNIAKNLYVISLTATVLTVRTLNGSAMVAEGPIASCTVTVTGKKTYVPTTGHTDQSYAIEHWYPDANPAMSELMTGCKVASIDIGLPATGMATLDTAFMGVGGITTSASAYYTSPTALTTTGITAAVNGVLYAAGASVAICTGASIKIDGGMSGDPVIGSNTMPNIFPGRVNVTGQATFFFDSATFRDYFLNETEFAMSLVLTSDNSAASDFLAITMPRIKLGSAQRSDSEKGIILTANFQALYNSAGGSGISTEQTTISIQDSAAA